MRKGCRMIVIIGYRFMPVFKFRFIAAMLGIILVCGNAHAQWREELGAFRIGIVADGDIADFVANLEPFRLAVEETLNVPVEIFPARDYPALISAVTGNRIEYAIFSATAYAAAWNLCECTEPLVIPRSGDGSTGYNQNIIAHIGGPSTLQDMLGKSLAIIGRDQIGGAMLALFELEQAGISADENGLKVRRFPSGEQAAQAFIGGTVDTLLGWQPAGTQASEFRGTFAYLAQLGFERGKLHTVWQSSLIPYRVHAIKRSLAHEAKQLMRTSMLELFDADPAAYDSLEPIFGGGYVTATPEQFSRIARMLAQRNIVADISSVEDNAPSVTDADSSEEKSE
jgi:phosphonate transport system substrate-binding protein